MANAELILAIIEAIIKYGPSAIIAIAGAVETSDPSADDIRALFIDKEPAEYFK